MAQVQTAQTACKSGISRPIRHIQAGLKTPLRKIGELPPELFLSCIAGMPDFLRAQLVAKWSRQLSSKKQTCH